VGDFSDFVDEGHDAGLEDFGTGGEISDVTEAKYGPGAFAFHDWIEFSTATHIFSDDGRASLPET